MANKVNGVTITITDEQIKSIDKQRIKPKWSKDEAWADRTDDDVHICKTAILMRSWAEFHNELDGFVPDWSDVIQYKYGIVLFNYRYSTDSYLKFNPFIFGIAVSSGQRAEQMLAEFKKDLEKIKW